MWELCVPFQAITEQAFSENCSIILKHFFCYVEVDEEVGELAPTYWVFHQKKINNGSALLKSKQNYTRKSFAFSAL